ncbi:ATP-dependent RNA helicase HelY [Paramicrobacterium humi]|uniref:ATP-dependent RNA helicase HelY n=1 Tax=Paramicrobacterium humi TaxID=640635 RepID=A0A1H4R517_9MICO|nr:DEAD/DEAH box helicase [Microbacterium humi]SEC27000.1 ATP-dependent RNA helicase HelY [Microbacterium humi]
MTASASERYSFATNASASLRSFRATQRFDLDPFQLAACTALDADRSVLVAAPTGAGKTIVAEYAIHLAMREANAKVFYTAPMKALSNQKYTELVEQYGADSVGLLTGDTNVNPRARIVVMTTEVLRNMLYADSDLLGGLAFVVLDEVHYLADRFRGAVWEEVIIHLPQGIRLVALSATVSNAEEFGAWLQTVRGDTEVIVSEERPVPLEQHVLMRGRLLDLFASTSHDDTADVNPELVRLAQFGGRSPTNKQYRDVSRYNQRRSPRRIPRMNRDAMVELLDEHRLLPAIFFIFSRKGCDQAVEQILRSGLRLTDQEERAQIREFAEERCRTLPDEDLGVLGYWSWLEGLQRGIAAHHAGMLPVFKEVVEELFRRKLLKLVFATETLALGINMPARTVVLEKLEKFNGEARVRITPGEYTQLTGRAGRRGIDVEGHSVIQWHESLHPQDVASLASKRSYPLTSSFRPTYNMAVNLISQFGRARTREVLESSFAQFQADRAVLELARTVREQEASLAGYEEAMTCDRGDFREYAAMRRELTDLERKSAAVHGMSHAQREKRQRRIASLQKQLRAHPCHRCPDRENHARWAERWWKLRRKTDELNRRIAARTGAVAAVFDRVTDVLVSLDYLQTTDDGRLEPTDAGEVLARVYGERDLLVAECLRSGIWDNLDPAALATIVCCLMYEPRRDDAEYAEQYLPRGAFRRALRETRQIWADLDAVEEEHRLTRSEPPSTGLAPAMHMWARGASLDRVLIEADMAAGDFVRWCRQTIDLLDQISGVASPELAVKARSALESVRRGIVAYSTI